VLVARNLAEANDGDAKPAHDGSPDPTAADLAGAAPDDTGVPS
jgi:hypothetical protein